MLTDESALVEVLSICAAFGSGSVCDVDCCCCVVVGGAANAVAPSDNSATVATERREVCSFMDSSFAFGGNIAALRHCDVAIKRIATMRCAHRVRHVPHVADDARDVADHTLASPTSA